MNREEQLLRETAGYLADPEVQAGLAILRDVAEERVRQDEKWGEQNHADGTGIDAAPLRAINFAVDDQWPLGAYDAPSLAVAAREACQANGVPGSPDTWTAILLEEVFEALAESEPGALRRELVQVAAVAVQWIEAIDRRRAGAA